MENKDNLENKISDRRSQARKNFEESPLAADLILDVPAEELVKRYNSLYLAENLKEVHNQKKGLEIRYSKAQDEGDNDVLTGLKNRRALEKDLTWHFSKLKSRYAGSKAIPPFTYMLLDLDDFKEVNTIYGYNGGDEVLKSVSKIISPIYVRQHIKNKVRNKSYRIDEKELDKLYYDVYRWGGEEFVILANQYPEQPDHLPRSTLSGLQIGQMILNTLNETPINFQKGDKLISLKKTASIGITGYDFGGYSYFDPHPEINKIIEKKEDDIKSIHDRANRADEYVKYHGKNAIKVYAQSKDIGDVPVDKPLLTRAKDALYVLLGKKSVR